MDYLPFAFAVAFAAIIFVGFPVVVRRGAGQPELTPRRVVAVALLTPAAAFIAFGEGAYAQPLVDSAVAIAGSDVGHVLFHFAWAVLALPIAFGLQRFRSNWPATGWTERCLAAVQMLALGVVAGKVLAGVGAAIPFTPPADSRENFWVGLDWGRDYIYFIHPHNVGEVLGVGSLLILLVVCLVMLGIGVGGALRPRAQLS